MLQHHLESHTCAALGSTHGQLPARGWRNQLPTGWLQHLLYVSLQPAWLKDVSSLGLLNPRDERRLWGVGNLQIETCPVRSSWRCNGEATVKQRVTVPLPWEPAKITTGRLLCAVVHPHFAWS